MNWMLLPLKRYADFTGRSRRMEFWMYTLFNAIVMFVLVGIMMVGILMSAPDENGEPGFGLMQGLPLILLALWALATLIPNIAVSVRRFHDQDKSGWMYLISFIPYIGGLIVLVFMCLPGTPGTNRFGADPKAVENLSEVFE